MNPKVSVIMSVYNGEKHIRRAINSILQQTFTDFEFIIANDGSTDATGKILSEYQNKDHRIVLVNQQNIGLTKTLNKLINFTTGEYIARQDADDVSLPERFALEVNFLNKNRDTVMVGSWYDVYFNSNVYWRVCPKPDYKSICKYLKKGINCFMHSSTMFKKSVIQKFAGPYRFRFAQDYDLWLRISEEYFVAIIPQYLAVRYESTDILSIKITSKIVQLRRVMLNLARERKLYSKEVSKWYEFENRILSDNTSENKNLQLEYNKRLALVAALNGKKTISRRIYFDMWRANRSFKRTLALIITFYPTKLLRLFFDLYIFLTNGMPHKYINIH